MSTISFARGIPAPECLPVDELADCARDAIKRDGAAALSYGSAFGYPPLRAWIGERHGVGPERVLISNGSLQGFVFLAQHLLADGPRRVIVEAPTYDRPLKILASLGAEVTAVPMDDEGLDLNLLQAAVEEGPEPALVYTIPTFQNPSGRTLSTARRERFAALAAQWGRSTLVLEDDPYGLVRFEGEAPPTLFELGSDDRVIYSSSFSKTIAPGVRVGYMVLPESLVAPLEAVAVSTYISPSFLAEAAVYEFVRRGLFEPNVERVRGLLKARRDAMLESLEQHFGGVATWSRPEGGYFVWLDLPEGTDSAALLDEATKAGVTFVKGTDFFPGGDGGRSSARLAFSFVSPDEIREGIARLASLVPQAAGSRV